MVGVEWGHELPNDANTVREDHRLTRAEAYVHDRVAYDVIRQIPGPNNIVMHGVFGSDYGILGTHPAQTIREGVILFGLGDVVYYCSSDGEKQVRSVVYDQVLTALDQYATERDVRLHVFAHSLGVTIAHDFLYGLFAPGITPDYQKQGDPNSVKRFDRWRQKALAMELKLGSFASAASQLPLLVMRKQPLVNQLFNGQRLDPRVIGVNGDQVKWKIFYDIDDLLGFATRGMYWPDNLIMDIQVDAGELPAAAHTGYWTNSTVIRETAELIYANAQ